MGGNSSPSKPAAQSIVGDLVGNMKSLILAEVYARVAHIPMLSHYTSFDAFASILQKRELWLSRVKDMSDTSEVTEGAQIVIDALREFGPNIFRSFRFSETDANERFTSIQPTLEADTFVISLCEHGTDQRTDRLTMWRAYGHNGRGLCLVLRKVKMLGQTAAGRFPVHWSPIEYENPTELRERVRRRLYQLDEVFSKASAEALDLAKPALGSLIVSGVLNLVLGHKNASYSDEREIRFIRSPLLNDNPPPAGAGIRNVGTATNPREVFVVPLRNYPEFPIDASVEALLDHIIIGPSDQQERMLNDVSTLLKADGLSAVKVSKSQIPYRAKP